MFAGGCETRAVAASLDKLHGRERFELGQRLRHGGLAQMQSFGCPPEVALAGDRQKAADMTKAESIFHYLGL
ncbi:hypothetical protein Busp01_01700 [Trinickia caryophylli]|nr:hypothetical protein Busp01_01700 [Trinickia caryophylli]